MADRSHAAPRPAHVPILFVGGLHRSGTSAVARLLASSSRVRGLTGTGAPQDEGQHCQPVVSAASAHGGPGLFAFDPGSHLTEGSPLVTSGNARRVLDAWLPFWHLSPGDRLGWAAPDRLVLLEKSPPNLVRTRFLQALFPAARFLVVIRHPGVVTMSTARWQPALAPTTLLRHWLHAHETLTADAAYVDHLHVLRYERLLADPAGAVDELTAALGVIGPFDMSTLEPGHDERHLEAWRAVARRLAPTDTAGLETRVRRFGYTLHEPYCPRQAPAGTG
jgi:hypothetical protein